jgi:hypothetical protein
MAVEGETVNDPVLNYLFAAFVGFCLGNAFQCWFRTPDGLDNEQFFDELEHRRGEDL